MDTKALNAAIEQVKLKLERFQEGHCDPAQSKAIDKIYLDMYKLQLDFGLVEKFSIETHK